MTKKPQVKPMKRKGWVVAAGTQAARPEACVYVNQAIGAEITYDHETKDWVGNCSISKNNWAIHRATPEATAIRLEQVVADYMLQTLKGMGNTEFACLQRRCKELEQAREKRVETDKAEVARLQQRCKDLEQTANRYLQFTEESSMEVARLRDSLNASFKERGCLQVDLEKARAELGATLTKRSPAQPHQYAPGSVCVLCGKPRNENKPTEASRQILTIRVVVDPTNP